MALDAIGDDLSAVIGSGLSARGKRNTGRGKIHELRKAQQAMQNARQQRNQSSLSSPSIDRVYIPRQTNGENTATRAMFIVLGEAKMNGENGLDKGTIISRGRHHTNVDFNAKHDKYGVYDGFKGMSTLIEKEYVIYKRRSKTYHITHRGNNVYKEHCMPQSGNQLNRYQNTNRNDDYKENDLERALALSLEQMDTTSTTNQTNANDDLERALALSLEQMETTKKKNQTNDNKTNQNTFICTKCIPHKVYKTRSGWETHMDKHNDINNADEKENKSNSNNRNKRKSHVLEIQDDDEIEVLPPRPRKRIKQTHKKKRTVVKDLDLLQKQHHGYSIDYQGEKYSLMLYVDTREQNLSNTSPNYFNIENYLKSEGVLITYKTLANCDYIIVISNHRNVYMTDFAVERKRFDDLRESVLVDGRGKEQKQRMLKTPITRKYVLVDGRGKEQKQRMLKTPITRKYYLVEGNERMIRNATERAECKQFLQDTAERDGYLVKYTQSKQESMNKIISWYFKISSLLHQGKDVIVKNAFGIPYSYEEFQISQKIEKPMSTYDEDLQRALRLSMHMN
eukprot:472898_1